MLSHFSARMKRHSPRYAVRATVWRYPGAAGWHFVTLPKKQSKDIKSAFGPSARGWGALPVTVTLGATSWKTSIFPDKKIGSYLLPIKAEVRKKEGVSTNATIRFTIKMEI